jgi:DivIVA domain-containing protein
MDRTLVADELRAARFRTTQFRTGYEMGDVDALLTRVTSALGGAPTPAATGDSTGSAAELPSAVIEPPRGFLARLRGR